VEKLQVLTLDTLLSKSNVTAELNKCF